jgi:hypothetical protein
LLQTGVTAIDEAVAALRKVEEGLADRSGSVSHVVTLLKTSAELLRAAVDDWDERTRSAEAEAGRRRELERREVEATRIWGRARDDWERTGATVSEVEVSLGRLHGALHETLGGEHRLLLQDVGLKVERLRGLLGPDRSGMEGLPLPPLDGRASVVAVVVQPHFWRITRALREVIRGGRRVLGYQELEALEGVVRDVTSLGEQLGLELRSGVTRWRASEIIARLEEMQETVARAHRHVPGSFTPPLVLRGLEETLEELRSVTSRLAALDPAGAPATPAPQD